MASAVSGTTPVQTQVDFFTHSRTQLGNARQIIAIVGDYFAVSKRRIEVGNASWKSFTGRVVFDSLLKKHLSAVWDEHFTSRDVKKVVELGSGFLDEDGQSFLTARLPKKLTVTFTDLNVAAVRDAKRRNYIHVDSSLIGASFSEGTFDAALGSCFIDNLSSPDLLRTLQGVHHILKKGGLFLHISDLQPLIDTMVTDYRNHPDVLFPWVSNTGFFIGLHLVPREVCNTFVKKESTEQEILYLQEYLSLSNDERAMLVIALCETKQIEPLSLLCVKYFESTAKRVKNSDYFSANLNLNLERAKFRILKSGIVTKQDVLPITQPVELNDVACFHGNIIKSKVSLPDPNTIRVTSGVHVIVAEKI